MDEQTRPTEPPAPEEAGKAEAEKLAGQMKDLDDKYRRALADLANLHKRFQKEREGLHAVAVAGFVGKLLPLVDNMAQSLKTAQETHDAAALIEGFRLLQAQMLQIFRENGIRPIEAEGKPFDPEYHHAVATEVTNRLPAGTVAEELGPGFVMGELVIRPARVRVAMAPPAGKEGEEPRQEPQGYPKENK